MVLVVWAATVSGACSLGSVGQQGADGGAGGAGVGGDAAAPFAWSVQTLPARGRSLALHGVGGDLYVAGENGMVIRTGDGARTWADVSVSPASVGATLDTYPVFEALGASAVDDVWVAGGPTPDTGLLMHTSDRGQSWQQVDAGTVSPIFGIWAVDRAHVIVSTSGGQILVTADGGASWTTAFSDPAMWLWGAWGSAGGGDLYVVGGLMKAGDGGADAIPTYTGVVLHSSDGGASWENVADAATPCILWRVSGTADGAIVYAVGDCGSVASTTDHGATWTWSGAVTAGGNYGISDVWLSPTGTPYLLQDGRGWNLNVTAEYVCHGLEVGDNGSLIAISTGCELLPPTSAGSISSPLAIWGTTDDDVWVAGVYGMLWHRP
jgi:photosystem II stability/assembly factor-like uncharacterized protein